MNHAISIPINLATGIFWFHGVSPWRTSTTASCRLGDSDDEDGVTGHPTLKVVETGVVTNEGIDTSPAAKHRGDLGDLGDGGCWGVTICSNCNVNMGGWSRNIGIFYQQDGGSIWFNQQKQSTKPTLMGYIYNDIYLASNMILWKWNRLRLVLMVENLGCLKVMYCKWMLSWVRNVEIHLTRKIWDHYTYKYTVRWYIYIPQQMEVYYKSNMG